MSQLYKTIKFTEMKGKRNNSVTKLDGVKGESGLIPNFSLVMKPFGEEEEMKMNKSILESGNGCGSVFSPVKNLKSARKQSMQVKSNDSISFRNYFKVGTERVKRENSEVESLISRPKMRKSRDLVKRMSKKLFIKMKDEDIERDRFENDLEQRQSFSVVSTEKKKLDKIITELESRRMKIQPISKSYHLRKNSAESDDFLMHSKTSSMAIKVEVLEPIQDENDFALPKVTGDRRLKKDLSKSVRTNFLDSDLSKMADIDEQSNTYHLKLPKFTKNKKFTILKNMNLKSRSFHPILPPHPSKPLNSPQLTPRTHFSPNPHTHIQNHLSPRLSLNPLSPPQNLQNPQNKIYKEYTQGKRLTMVNSRRRMKKLGSYESGRNESILGKGERLRVSEKRKGFGNTNGRKSFDILDIVRLQNGG